MPPAQPASEGYAAFYEQLVGLCFEYSNSSLGSVFEYSNCSLGSVLSTAIEQLGLCLSTAIAAWARF